MATENIDDIGLTSMQKLRVLDNPSTVKKKLRERKGTQGTQKDPNRAWRRVSGTRATPIPTPCIHVNLSFPTPIIISFTPSLFLTDSYPFRNAWDGQPVPNYCWISPVVAFMVIDRRDDRPISIRRMRMCHQCRGWSPVRVAIVDKASPLAVQRYYWQA